MQEIAKHFDEEEEGFEVVEDAIDTMTCVAWYINDMKRRHEHAVRLQVLRAGGCRDMQGWLGGHGPGEGMSLPCTGEQRGGIRVGQVSLGKPSSGWIFRSLQEPSGVPSKVMRSLTLGVGAFVLQEIQSLLINWKGPDLTIYGELVLEGTFRLHRVRNEKTFFLFDKALLITKKRGDHFVYKGHIPVTRLLPSPLRPCPRHPQVSVDAAPSFFDYSPCLPRRF